MIKTVIGRLIGTDKSSKNSEFSAGPSCFLLLLRLKHLSSTLQTWILNVLFVIVCLFFYEFPNPLRELGSEQSNDHVVSHLGLNCSHCGALATRFHSSSVETGHHGNNIFSASFSKCCEVMFRARGLCNLKKAES